MDAHELMQDPRVTAAIDAGLYAWQMRTQAPTPLALPALQKVAAGILHGYRGEFQDKIPMNSSGFAPAIVPSVGYCIHRYCSEFVLFGTAGFLITVGVTIP